MTSCMCQSVLSFLVNPIKVMIVVCCSGKVLLPKSLEPGQTLVIWALHGLQPRMT